MILIIAVCTTESTASKYLVSPLVLRHSTHLRDHILNSVARFTRLPSVWEDGLEFIAMVASFQIRSSAF